MGATVRQQAGVSLIELVSVMFIGTLLWASVLAVQSAVDRTTAHTLLQEMLHVKTMLYSYRDRYGAVPGDDGRAAEHVAGAVNAAGGAPDRAFPDDGMISSGNHQWAIVDPAPFAGPGNAPEPALFWNHVRRAGLEQGDPLAFPVYNAVQGYLGVGDDGPRPPAGVGGHYKACSSGIEGHIAKLMDERFDDGDATSGKLFAAVEPGDLPVTASRAAASPYSTGQTFTVCMLF